MSDAALVFVIMLVPAVVGAGSMGWRVGSWLCKRWMGGA